MEFKISFSLFIVSSLISFLAFGNCSPDVFSSISFFPLNTATLLFPIKGNLFSSLLEDDFRLDFTIEESSTPKYSASSLMILSFLTAVSL